MRWQPPDELRETYKRWQWTVVWEWPNSATTWRLDDGEGAIHYLKVGRAGRWPNALDECGRIRWARPFVRVPEVVDCGSDGAVDWLLTVALEGTDATKHPLVAQPSELVPALARGLREFHAAAPVDICPFEFTVESALAHVRQRVQRGLVDPTEHLHPEHSHLTLEHAIARLERLAPVEEDVVVCHGDYCLPNVMLDENGRVTGYLDLGELAVADRWWDIAVGSWSVTWNLGPGWEDLFIASYGTRPDPRRISFYRLLYDLAS